MLMTPTKHTRSYFHPFSFPPAHIYYSSTPMVQDCQAVYGDVSFHLLQFMFIICTIFSLFYVQSTFCDILWGDNMQRDLLFHFY